jgi:hypothetical protein
MNGPDFWKRGPRVAFKEQAVRTFVAASVRAGAQFSRGLPISRRLIRHFELSAAMLKRLTALAFILVIGGGVLAGAPLHSHGQECEMGDMAGMDCCAKAREQSDAPEVLAARLCCAFNCSQPAPTGPTAAFDQQKNQANASSPVHLAAIPPANWLPLSLSRGRSHHLPQNLQPSYVLHSALLI